MVSSKQECKIRTLDKEEIIVYWVDSVAVDLSAMGEPAGAWPLRLGALRGARRFYRKATREFAQRNIDGIKGFQAWLLE